VLEKQSLVADNTVALTTGEQNVKVKICGIGCSLMDYLYTDISFGGEAFRRYESRAVGDGGLAPGKLVFCDELERFAGKGFDRIRREITGGQAPRAANLGGPSIVALIHAAQLLAGSGTTVRFFGARGDDRTGEQIREIIGRTPVDSSAYRIAAGQSPFTVVLSDPTYDGGHGERTFVNNIGAAGSYLPDEVDRSFFDGDILEFGGTALVPGIHDHIDVLLRRGRAAGKVTVVNTVYDFRGEKLGANVRWPLGASDATFADIDLFIADREEALRTTGTESIEDALLFLREKGVAAAVVTEGAHPVHLYSSGRLFASVDHDLLPVSEKVAAGLRSGSVNGDTTGCGDNFTGGVLASLAEQLQRGLRGSIDLRRACSLGVVSGGHACYYVGGTFLESRTGEKREQISALYRDYIRQTGDRDEGGPF